MNSGVMDGIKISSRDRKMQRTMEQTLEVEKIILPYQTTERISEQSEFVKLREISSQNQTLQRTVKQILNDTVHEPVSRISERICVL